MKRVRRRRRIDKEGTIRAYRARLAALDPAAFRELDGAYLSTYGVYNTVADPDVCHERMKRCNAVVLLQLARSLGVAVRGVTSERRSAGKYLCDRLLDGEPRASAKIVYVGQYNYFTNKVPHPLFSIRAADKVYEAD